jgi:hypothetical protein
MEEWSNGKIPLTLFNPHHSRIPIFHYPNISILPEQGNRKEMVMDLERLKINIIFFNSSTS